VDITMVSPSAAQRVSCWRVVEDMRGETLSDHLYIEVVVGTTRQQVHRSSTEGEGRRQEMGPHEIERGEPRDRAVSVTWGLQDGEGEGDIHQEVDWLVTTMHRVCDEAMPRVKSHPPRRATYWWTDELAELRRSSVHARRALSRIPRQGNPEEREAALAVYREARCALSRAIRKCRAKCWDDKLSSLNTDPWGRPYKIMLKRHRAWTPPATESLEPRVPDEVVDTLFPSRVEGSTLEWGPGLDGLHDLTENQEVSGDELSRPENRVP